tara:strand:+ start:540 stop:824 length:285 start_codon:yes stop_codon:yes gene_type:complete
MAYDANKDKLIADLGAIPNTNMGAELRCYDEGETRVSIFRTFEKKDKKTGKKVPARRQVVRLGLKDAVNLGEFLVAVTAKHGVADDTEDEVENF